MSRKANPAVVGGFVLGAIALTVAAVAAFGGGKFFTHRERAVAFFEGDIQGLAVGSAVNLRGVQVGAVTDIALRLDVKTMHPVIAVYMEFDRNRIHFDRAVSATEMAEHEPLRTAIANGLHASLATQSLVTGQLVVELDLEPDKPTRLLGADPSTVEIPTSPSDFDKLKNTITQLPLDQIAAAALKLLRDMDQFVSSDDNAKLVQSLTSTSDNLSKLINDARADLPQLVADVHDTSRAGRDTLQTSTSTLQQADRTLADVDSLVSPNSPQRYALDQTLANLSAASRSLRTLAEELERRPNSILVGK